MIGNTMKSVNVFLMVLALSGNIFAWVAGKLTVDVTNSPMNIKVSVTTGGKVLAEITKVTFGTVNYTAVTAVKEYTGSYGDNDDDALELTLSGNTKLFIISVPGGLRFLSENPTVSSVTLTMKDQGEHFYGITQHNLAQNPDLRGQSGIKDRIAAYKGKEDAETYAGFFYTTLGYAGYFDSFARGSYTFGVSGATTITYEYKLIDWYLFYGPKLSTIHSNYYQLVGAPRPVPMWACGPLIWCDNYSGSAMMIEHAKGFYDSRIPFSSMWLDRPYNSGPKGYYPMNFDGNFANPQVWIGTLANDYYINLATWIMPGTFSEGPKIPNCLTSSNNYFDLTDPVQVDYYKGMITKGQYNLGIKGHKLDRVDNGWSSTYGSPLPPFKDGTPEPERHKKYAYLNCKVTDEMVRDSAKLGDTALIFTRCASHRCHQYMTGIWNGDTEAEWPGLVVSMGNGIRAAVQGWAFWGSDICGFEQRGMPTMQNYSRWSLFGVYSGFMEFMVDFKEPWKLSTANQEIIRNIYNQRFELLPYVYSILNTSVEGNYTMMPLFAEYPDDSKTYSIWNEYMFGPCMLVAPLYTAVPTRSIYLPAGKWINKNDYADEQTGGGSNITCPTMSLTQLPVYIKANSIYPTGKIYGGLTRKWETDYDSKRNLVINVFPGAAGESSSFTYVDYIDGNKHKDMTVSVSSANSISVTSPAMTVPCTVVVRLPAAPTSVYAGTTKITSPQYNTTSKKLTVPFTANQPISVSINGEPTLIQKQRPVMMHGIITARNLGRRGGVQISIPRMSGIKENCSAVITIYTMTGRSISKNNVVLNRYAPTQVSVNLGKGSFLAEVTVDGNSAGKTMVTVQ